jgi:hypothetical protein
VIELPENDDELLAELGAVLLAEDPMPASVVAAARGAMVWRTVDAELAVLSADSLLVAVGGVRGGDERQLTFESPSVSVEIDIVEGGHHLMGQVVPPQAGRIELAGPRIQAGVDADRHGQFVLDAPVGPARLRFRPESGPSVVTDWVTL